MGRFREALAEGWESPATKIAAIVILAIAGLVAIFVIILSIFAPVKPADGDAGGDAGSTRPPSRSEAPISEGSGNCDVPAGDTSFMPLLPDDLRWTAEGGVTWPVSDTFGPTKAADGRGVCFARSPLGAALLVATMTAGASQQSSTVEDYLFYIAEGTGKDAFAAAAASYSGSSSDLQTGRSSIAGFRTVSFTGSEAEVALVMTAPNTVTGYIEGYFTLDWIDDDWRIRVLDNGQFAPVPYATVADTGFVDWRAE